MRLVLDLPDWCDERNIYVMAGIELVAYKRFGEDAAYVKAARCNSCGACCRAPLLPGAFEATAEGDCVHLKKIGPTYVCGLGAGRPFVCNHGDPVRMGIDGAEGICSIRYKQVKVR